MSSTRWLFNAFKYSSVPGINITVAYAGYRQYQHNHSIIKSLPADQQRLFAGSEKIGNSGDALAVFNERAYTRITHTKD